MDSEPSPETIIEAELVDDEPTYEFNIQRDNEIDITEIKLFIIEKTNHIIYEKIISKDSEYWNKIKIKFQNNFDIFYVFLECVLVKRTNDNLRYEIILENFINLKLELYYTSELFSFKIDMLITKQKEKIDILKEENDELKKKVETLQEKVESLCKIVDMMGPQYMRSIIGADKLYANYNLLGTIQRLHLNDSKLSKVIPGYSGAPAEPVKYLDELKGCEDSHSTGGEFSVNKRNEMEWKHSGNPPDALVWSKTAWELIKKEKQWDID
jgi:hypothetical protein